MLICLCKYVPCSKHSIVFLCHFVHIRCIFRKISRYKLSSTRRDGGLFEQLEVRSANQITRLDNKEIQNINKRPQWVLDEGGPLSDWKDEAWKISGLQRDSNPWPPRDRCDARPTELWSHTLGARSICWVHIYLLVQWNDVKNIWNSYCTAGHSSLSSTIVAVILKMRHFCSANLTFRAHN